MLTRSQIEEMYLTSDAIKAVIQENTTNVKSASGWITIGYLAAKQEMLATFPVEVQPTYTEPSLMDERDDQ